VAESPDVSGRLTLRAMSAWRQFLPPSNGPSQRDHVF
jgi:hypothetical protein